MSKLGAFFHEHLGAAIAAVSMAVVIVGGILVLTLLGNGGSSTVSTTTPTTATTVAPHASTGGGAAKRGQGVRGTITAINGNTWTVQSASGVTVTVEVGPNTAFGTKAKPLSPSDFAVGDRVVVVGSRDKTTVVASRITAAGAGRKSAGNTTTTTSA